MSSSSPFSFGDSKKKAAEETLLYLKSNSSKLAFPIALFYSLSLLSQRIFGLVSIHGGRSRYLLSASGFCATFLGLYSTHYATDQMVIRGYIESTKYPPSVSSSSSSGWLGYLRPLFGKSNMSPEKEIMNKTGESLLYFLIIEHRMFRTMLPSSVLTIGVFANPSLSKFISIHASSDVATQSERLKVQSLGKKFGCHHCGSRQIFSRGSFIADHMPPTKHAKEMNAAWWRRFLGLKVTQRLWAQCQSCFSMQGSAVRADIHRLAYYNRLRLVHMIPSVTLLMNDLDVHFGEYMWSQINKY